MSLDWWQKSVIYHVYVPAFKDSNGDGIGDLRGLISKLDYFVDLKISTLMLSPLCPSPMKDNGYDISSYVDIDLMYGTLQDFDELMQEAKKRDLNIIIDFVPNHTSDQHEWFVKSVQKIDPYTDYYIWKNSLSQEESVPPNNWLSVFHGSAWTWNEQRKQFYFHQFLPEQPDLNHTNLFVKEEMKGILEFWLRKGVDGFRIDAASHLMEDPRFLDEPVAEQRDGKIVEPHNHGYLEHIYTKGVKETLKLLEEWRTVLDEHSRKTGKTKVMMVEAVEKPKNVVRYYGTHTKNIAEIPLNFQFYKITPESTGREILELINDWMMNIPKGKYPNWVMSSHDDPRVATRVGPTLAISLQMVQMLLPGVPVCYYGDELGMHNGEVQPEEMRDSFALRTVPENSRDPMRTPMQWDSTKNAGFSDCDTPWLPVNCDYKIRNAELQHSDPVSCLSTFRQLMSIRQEPSVLFGTISHPIVTDSVFTLLRSLVGVKCYLLVVNVGPNTAMLNMRTMHDGTCTEPQLQNNAETQLHNHAEPHVLRPNRRTELDVLLPEEAELEATSSMFYLERLRMRGNTGHSKVALSGILLEKHEAVLLSFVGKSPFD